MVSAVPSSIQRVAIAAEIGDAITQSARMALLNDQPAAGVGRDDIGQTQAGADALGEARDMPADVGRDGREGRRAVRRNEAVGVVLDDRDLERRASEQMAARRRSGIVIVVGFCSVGLR